MKIKGVKPSDPNTEIIVIPRADGNDLVFKAQAVLDTSAFEALCKLPTAPHITVKGGESGQDFEDPEYLKKLQAHIKLKSDWITLKSLQATPDLEWEGIDMSKPETWSLYLDELRDFKLSDYEIRLIIQGVQSANGLDENKIDAARMRFLASQVVKQST